MVRQGEPWRKWLSGSELRFLQRAGEDGRTKLMAPTTVNVRLFEMLCSRPFMTKAALCCSRQGYKARQQPLFAVNTVVYKCTTSRTCSRRPLFIIHNQTMRKQRRSICPAMQFPSKQINRLIRLQGLLCDQANLPKLSPSLFLNPKTAFKLSLKSNLDKHMSQNYYYYYFVKSNVITLQSFLKAKKKKPNQEPT